MRSNSERSPATKGEPFLETTDIGPRNPQGEIPTQPPDITSRRERTEGIVHGWLLNLIREGENTSLNVN